MMEDNNAQPVVKSEKVSYSHMDNWTKPFWRSVVSSENGSGSTSRVSTLCIIIATLIFAGYLIYINKAIPMNLMTLGMFSALLVCVVYSPSKIAGLFKSFFEKK
jgi:hypothetical protein